MLLAYTTEARCFEIMETMIVLSEERNKIEEKFITINAEQFKLLVAVICKCVYKEVEGLQSLIQAKKIDFPSAVAGILKNFFIEYFKFSFLLRTLNWVLSEGHTAIIKIMVGIFKAVSVSISEFHSDFQEDLKMFCYSFDNDEEIFFSAMKTKLKPNLSQNLELPTLKGLTCFRIKDPDAASPQD